MFKHLSFFLDERSLINNRQHSLRKGFSPVTQLLETVHDIEAILAKQGQIDMIFLNWKETFWPREA